MPQTAASHRERVTVVDHPLVQHKLSLMRRRDTSTVEISRADARDQPAARL